MSYQVCKTQRFPLERARRVESVLQRPALAQVWRDECNFVPSSPLDGFEDYGPDRDSMRVTAFLDIPGQDSLPPLVRLEKYAFSENIFNRWAHQPFPNAQAFTGSVFAVLTVVATSLCQLWGLPGMWWHVGCFQVPGILSEWHPLIRFLHCSC